MLSSENDDASSRPVDTVVIPDLGNDLCFGAIAIQMLRDQIKAIPGDSRERSLALTKLQEAEFWLSQASFMEA